MQGPTTLGTMGGASFSTTAIPVGSHDVVAVYSGDTNVSTGSSTAVTGTVTVSDGATVLGTGALDAGGVAKLATATLTVGSHTINATYGGDATYVAGPTGTVMQVVGKAASKIALDSSENPSSAGDSVTFTATVSSKVSGSGRAPPGQAGAGRGRNCEGAKLYCRDDGGGARVHLKLAWLLRCGRGVRSMSDPHLPPYEVTREWHPARHFKKDRKNALGSISSAKRRRKRSSGATSPARVWRMSRASIPTSPASFQDPSRSRRTSSE